MITASAEEHKLWLNIRPIRIAYLLEDADEVALKRIILFCCSQWGGIRQLIIPVDAQNAIGTLSEALLRLYEPDWFVSYLPYQNSADAERHNTLQAALRQRFPLRPLTLQHGSAFERWDPSAHVLSTIEPRPRGDEYLVIPELRGGAADLLGLVLHGGIPTGQEAEFERITGCTTIPITPGSEDFWERQFSSRRFDSPLNLTQPRTHARARGGIAISEYFFTLIVGDSVPDFCVYWNIRALREGMVGPMSQESGRRTLLASVQQLRKPDSLAILARLMRQHRFVRGERSNLHLFVVCSDPADAPRVRRALNRSGHFRALHSGERWRVRLAGGQEERADSDGDSEDKLVYVFGYPGLPDSCLEGLGPYVPRITPLREGENEVFFEPPESYVNSSGGSVMLDLECDLWQRFPKSVAVSELIKGGSWFSRYGVSMATSVPTHSSYVTFSVPNDLEALRAWFREKGYELRPTRISDYSEAVLSLLGGLTGAELLASELAFGTLDGLSLRSTKKVAQRLQSSGISEDLLRDLLRDVQFVDDLNRGARTCADLASLLGARQEALLPVLHRLSEAGILRRGFLLPCPRCSASDWYAIEAITDPLACTGCAFGFVLPVVDQGGAELRTQYRLNTLVNRAMDQDAIPGILAAWYVTRGRTAGRVNFALQAILDGRAAGDWDFLFVADRAVIGGECKSGSELGRKDFATAELAARLGFQSFYFCTVRAFSDETRSRIRGLGERLSSDGVRMEIGVLSRVELLQGAAAGRSG